MTMTSGKFRFRAAALALAGTLALPAFTAGMAGPFQAPPHLSRYQAGKAPFGFRNICGQYPWACSNRAAGKITGDNQILSIARKVNSQVNRLIRPVSDQAQFGVKEKWTLPTSGSGDCEDYVLMKLKKLIDAGVAPNRLFMAQVLPRRYEQHVVLIVRTGKGDYVLDNLTSSVRTWRQTGYTFLKMQNARNARKWDVVLLGPMATRK
jgi:predicted transglutaminase-like cysteine proteinase